MKKNKWIIGVLAAVLLVLAVSTGVVLAETLPETYVETTEPGEPSEVEPEPEPEPESSFVFKTPKQFNEQPKT